MSVGRVSRKQGIRRRRAPISRTVKGARRKGPTARARAKKARGNRAREAANKQTVRDRDQLCRFPFCGCARARIMLHVSHRTHKGMGGNPTGSRSTPPLMILVCATRHREGRMSIDAGTLGWRGVTAAGANGPVNWYLKAETLARFPDVDVPMEAIDEGMRTGWIKLAGGIELHAYITTDWQRAILDHLAEMNL